VFFEPDICRPTRLLETHPRPLRLDRKSFWIPAAASLSRARDASCRVHRLQFSVVVTFSFFPNREGYRGNLPCQGQTRQRRWCPLYNHVFKTGFPYTCRNSLSRSLEYFLHRSVVVIVQTAQQRPLFRSAHATVNKLVLRARGSDYAQPTIPPELLLGAKAMRRARDTKDYSRTDGSNPRDASKDPGSRIFPCLRH